MKTIKYIVGNPGDIRVKEYLNTIEDYILEYDIDSKLMKTKFSEYDLLNERMRHFINCSEFVYFGNIYELSKSLLYLNALLLGKKRTIFSINQKGVL